MLSLGQGSEDFMSKKIVIVDYEMGNVHSVHNALLALGYTAKVSRSVQDIEEADGIVLPGVGAFPKAMENLNSFGLTKTLNRQVMELRKPFLGICLGMQLLSESSDEGRQTRGLGWIKGEVVAVPPHGVKVPHVGWNDVALTEKSLLFSDISAPTFYFDHSYQLQCDESIVSAWCEYGQRFVAAIQFQNVFATQFHPEKSQKNGLKLLSNFLKFVRESSHD